ncbi:MAG: DUF1799 domain-containing protein [Pigmentiphaga sp.]
MIASLVKAGAPQEVIDSARASMGSDDFEVLEENLEIVNVFVFLGTSWTLATLPMGGAVQVGIPSSEIESTMRMMGIKKKDRMSVFTGIRIMEKAALEVMSK